jgi:hypothetical protein
MAGPCGCTEHLAAADALPPGNTDWAELRRQKAPSSPAAIDLLQEIAYYSA